MFAGAMKGGNVAGVMGISTRFAKIFPLHGFLLALMNADRVVLPVCVFCRRVVFGRRARNLNPRLR